MRIACATLLLLFSNAAAVLNSYRQKLHQISDHMNAIKQDQFRSETTDAETVRNGSAGLGLLGLPL